VVVNKKKVAVRSKAKNKTKRIEIRVTEENFQRIHREARALKITVTDYLTKILQTPSVLKTLYSIEDFVLDSNISEGSKETAACELRNLLCKYYRLDDMAKAAMSATLGKMLPAPMGTWTVVEIKDKDYITCDPDNLIIENPNDYSRKDRSTLAEIQKAIEDSDRREYKAKKALEAPVNTVDIETVNSTSEGDMEVTSTSEDDLYATVAGQTVDSQHELALSDTVPVSVEAGRSIAQERAVGVSDRFSTYHRCTSNVGVDRSDNDRERNAVSLLSNNETLDLGIVNGVVALT
jgi:hypothetical protein